MKQYKITIWKMVILKKKYIFVIVSCGYRHRYVCIWRMFVFMSVVVTV